MKNTTVRQTKQRPPTTVDFNPLALGLIQREAKKNHLKFSLFSQLSLGILA